MPEPVLDTVSLRVMAFAHPDGIAILFNALGMNQARFPAEVYNHDENALPLDVDDATLSELARGLRYARRQVAARPANDAARYATWLTHATQIDRHLVLGSLVIDPLTVHELPLRDRHRAEFGIGRGEAACLALAQHLGAASMFLSSDTVACQAAAALGVPFLTLQDVLMAWVKRVHPSLADVDSLIAGMRAARFGLAPELVDTLRQLAH